MTKEIKKKKDRKKRGRKEGSWRGGLLAYVLVHNLEALNSFPRNHVEN